MQTLGRFQMTRPSIMGAPACSPVGRAQRQCLESPAKERVPLMGTPNVPILLIGGVPHKVKFPPKGDTPLLLNQGLMFIPGSPFISPTVAHARSGWELPEICCHEHPEGARCSQESEILPLQSCPAIPAFFTPLPQYSYTAQLTIRISNSVHKHLYPMQVEPHERSRLPLNRAHPLLDTKQRSLSVRV